MGFFDFLFGKRKDATLPPPEVAPAPAQGAAGSRKHDPTLITRLKQEHQTLLKLFGAIKAAQQGGDFGGLKYALQEFQITLNMHLAEENAQFYAYLRRSLKHGSPEHATMTSFWDEMQEIGKVVTQFLRKYIATEFTPEVLSVFGAELDQIGAALVGRIEREEKDLYGLYA